MRTFDYVGSGYLAEMAALMSALHEDERGDNENLGRLLILALIMIPLIILIVFFGNNIAEAAKKAWDNLVKNPVKDHSK